MNGHRDVAAVLDGKAIYLADTPQPYRHYLTDTIDERRDIAGTDTRAEVQRAKVREWKLDDWSGGFGWPVWSQTNPNRYNTGRNVLPEFRTSSPGGLALGPGLSTAQVDTPAAFSPNGAFLFRGSNTLQNALTVYASKTQALHEWLPLTGYFDATALTAGSASGVCHGIADPGDGYLYVLDSADMDVYQVDNSPTNILHVDRSATSPQWSATGAAIGTFRGEVYVAGLGGDLHRIDRSTTNAVTRVVDAFYDGLGVMADSPLRLTASDKGPLWMHPTRFGTDIWEYNVAEDSASIIHRLDPGLFPWGIFWFGGFTFIGYSQSFNTAIKPNGYLYYFRGGQSGTLGPLVDVADSFYTPIAGVLQGQYLVVVVGTFVGFDEGPYDMFVYDLREGAWHHLAQSNLTPSSVWSGISSVVSGNEIFTTTADTSTLRVERVDMDTFNIRGVEGVCYLDTGRYDFDLPGVQKMLVDVTIVTDPLPADTDVDVELSLDGAAFATAGITHSVDGATTFTKSFAVGSSKVFNELEMRINLLSDTLTSTPTIRSVTARALPISVQEWWDIDVDLNPSRYQNVPSTTGSPINTYQDMVTVLRGMRTNRAAVTFINPWEVDTLNDESRESDTVVVTSVTIPDIGADETRRYARVRLMKAELST